MTPRRLLIALVVLALAGFAVMSRRGGPDATDVDLATVTRVPALQSFVTASGEIVATRYADIGSSAMGRLVGLAVKEGDRVKAGQVLARIDRVQAASSAAAAAAGLVQLLASALGVPIGVSLTTLAVAISAAGLSGILAGWYPARRATRLDVITALRTE